MTAKELCEVFSKEIGTAFELSKEEIKKQLVAGRTVEMTTEEVCAKMILNSLIISANLSAQTMINGLVEMNVIPTEALTQTKLKPDIHLVKTSQQSAPYGGRGRETNKSYKGTDKRTAKENRRKTETEITQISHIFR